MVFRPSLCYNKLNMKLITVRRVLHSGFVLTNHINGGLCMDYKKCAEQILAAIGGKDNLASAAHCATRLRLVIADNGKVQKKTLENVDGVKGVFEAAGQLHRSFESLLRHSLLCTFHSEKPRFPFKMRSV